MKEPELLSPFVDFEDEGLNVIVIDQLQSTNKAENIQSDPDNEESSLKEMVGPVIDPVESQNPDGIGEKVVVISNEIKPGASIVTYDFFDKIKHTDLFSWMKFFQFDDQNGRPLAASSTLEMSIL